MRSSRPYTFSAELEETTLSGKFVATDDGSELSIPDAFTLERH